MISITRNLNLNTSKDEWDIRNNTIPIHNRKLNLIHLNL